LPRLAAKPVRKHQIGACWLILKKEFRKIEIKSVSDLKTWLENNCQQSESVWLVRYKKIKPEYHVAIADVIDQLLCFGWIDSVPKKLDQNRTRVLVSKRRIGSNWSAYNKRRASELIKRGLMTPTGLAAVERAKKDGAWSFLDDVESLILSKDLIAELKKYPQASLQFSDFSRSQKRGILEWIKNAKKPETREARIIEAAFLAQESLPANQP
jgi:uncharacterized protein YdeI (YjbR/CyaY-like superfamily)